MKRTKSPWKDAADKAFIRSRPNNLRETCLAPHCDQPAAKCHLLSQKLILDVIAEGGKLVNLRPKGFDGGYWKFESRDTKSSLVAHLFCPKHDSSMFCSVEDGAPPYGNPRHFLRAAAHEYKKCRGNVACTAPNKRDPTNALIRQQIHEHIFLHLWQLATRNESLPTFVREIAQVGVCMSTLATYAGPGFIRLGRDSELALQLDLAPVMLVNVYPSSINTTVCVFAAFTPGLLQRCLSVLRLNNATDSWVAQVVRNIMLTCSEDWCISPTAYRNIAANSNAFIECKSGLANLAGYFPASSDFWPIAGPYRPIQPR